MTDNGIFTFYFFMLFFSTIVSIYYGEFSKYEKTRH